MYSNAKSGEGLITQNHEGYFISLDVFAHPQSV